MPINRRAWLKGLTGVIGLGLVGGGLTWRWLGTPDLADLSGWTGFSPDDIALLNEIADTIIPTTDTPGAKAADVGAFIAVAVTECFAPLDQSAFVAGLRKLESDCHENYGQGFRQIAGDQRMAVLKQIDSERKLREMWNRGERGLRLLARPVFGLGPQPAQTRHFLTMMGELTVIGYFTSEPGATQALRHMATPGAFDGALPYKKGDRVWSM